MRPALCEDALRLGRILAGLAPNEPEVHGLVALMEIQASRVARASRLRRAGPAAGPGPRALGSAADPARPGGAARAETLADRGPYALQAAIAACHARARTAEDTDWARIAALYDELARSALAGRGAESRGGGVDGRRSRGRPDAGRRARRRAGAGAYACCPACAPICCPSWAASQRRAPSSSARRGWTRNTRLRDRLLARAAALAS